MNGATDGVRHPNRGIVVVAGEVIVIIILTAEAELVTAIHVPRQKPIDLLGSPVVC
jgi:hypothetical protein